MSYSLTITADSPENLWKEIAHILVQHQQAPTAGIGDVVQTAQRRRRRKAVEPEPSTAPAPDMIEAATVGEAPADDVPPEGWPTPTLENCKAVIEQMLATDGVGVSGAKALLREFGVDRLSQLPEAKFGEFIAAGRVRL